ncbi:hypothetical protein C2G38_2061726 [Gigaspora rosea]|uniref:Uncharacterized protein n=1 Tax=Gigaspora rosea TaxID=44941 RepID=A0A397W0E5_9GLOM|nr:hypothetical protein C2G38_2061726 [Gigaspora rosea]
MIVGDWLYFIYSSDHFFIFLLPSSLHLLHLVFVHLLLLFLDLVLYSIVILHLHCLLYLPSVCIILSIPLLVAFC